MRRVHENFVGLEKADDATRVAMLNFTVSMTMGNLDEAFRAIAGIKRFDILLTSKHAYILDSYLI